MQHILDNPIWHALHSGNLHLSFGDGNARFMKRDVGIFAGLKTNSEKELNELHNLLPVAGNVILFVPESITIPEGWKIKLNREILQMVYEQSSDKVNRDGLVKLRDQDIPAMIELTHLTNPGPFFTRTIDFGNYEGIFENDRLVAMTGQRLQPDPYTEVSAVCTHPDHTGKGYAARLVQSQLQSITEDSRIPFLHLYPDNFPALRLYEKLGFRIRKAMIVYFLEKI